jgi:hypothetical protein
MFGAASLPERIELRRLGGRGLQLLGSVPPPGSLRVDTRSAGDFNGDGADDLAFSETGFLTVVYGFTPRGPFARGDANSDGAINITDGVYVLTYLFLGGAEPLCEDAADADDKGTIRLTDAVYLFNHLFLGGPEPPPPYPGAGVDPTEDELSCFGF